MYHCKYDVNYFNISLRGIVFINLKFIKIELLDNAFKQEI